MLICMAMAMFANDHTLRVESREQEATVKGLCLWHDKPIQNNTKKWVVSNRS